MRFEKRLWKEYEAHSRQRIYKHFRKEGVKWEYVRPLGWRKILMKNNIELIGYNKMFFVFILKAMGHIEKYKEMGSHD